MATIPDVADALVTVLNDADLSQSFTAVRKYRPIYELREIGDLTITVVPKEQGQVLADRVRAQMDFGLDIGIQKKLTTGGNAEVDILMELVEEIIDLIRNTRVFGVAKWMKTENNPIFAPEHLSEMRVFTSILTVTLRAFIA
ncbi:hypothetical protein LCGC14_2448080 [marine sediment metagenome]|uniref:Uncharacterized protein n=1 Tax=marine sediment metagenome TaxID=412755 RepID=A0A0F9BH82_9ZZZZ